MFAKNDELPFFPQVSFSQNVRIKKKSRNFAVWKRLELIL